MRNLLWKEWHEQSWKLAFGCIVLASLALIGLRARIVTDDTMMMWVCFLGITLLPILSSTGLIPAERAEGSFESLLAMPIKPWQILAAKTLMGLLLCAGPLIVGGCVSLLYAGDREITGVAVIDLYGRSILASLSLFFWMLMLTSRLPSEARAGLIAVGVLILWSLISPVLMLPPCPPVLFAASPISFVYGLASPAAKVPELLLVIAIQTAIIAPLWWCTVAAFKKPT